MKREVAAGSELRKPGACQINPIRTGSQSREFSLSMSDFKPGDKSMNTMEIPRRLRFGKKLRVTPGKLRLLRLQVPHTRML